MLKYSITIQEGNRSVGLVNFGRTYQVCDTPYIKLECSLNEAIKLAGTFNADHITVYRQGQGRWGGYQDVVWTKENGIRQEIYDYAQEYDAFVNSKCRGRR